MTDLIRDTITVECSVKLFTVTFQIVGPQLALFTGRKSKLPDTVTLHQDPRLHNHPLKPTLYYEHTPVDHEDTRQPMSCQ